jgi:hypothetical protein
MYLHLKVWPFESNLRCKGDISNWEYCISYEYQTLKCAASHCPMISHSWNIWSYRSRTVVFRELHPLIRIVSLTTRLVLSLPQTSALSGGRGGVSVPHTLETTLNNSNHIRDIKKDTWTRGQRITHISRLSGNKSNCFFSYINWNLAQAQSDTLL